MKPVSITGVKEQIKPIVDELRGIEVEAVYLFGFYAKGNANKRDEIALQRVKVATLKSYLDIQPMIKRHCIHVLSFQEDKHCQKVRGEYKGGP